MRVLLLWLFVALLCAPLRARAGDVVRLEAPVFVGGFGLGFFEETARAFEAARPGVAVDLYGDPRIADKLGVRLLEGDTPDLTDANLPWARLIDSGAVLDLTPYLDGPSWEGDRPWRDTFIPGALDRWTVGGRVYGVPFAHAVWAFFYDKRLFARHGWTPPRTWDEFFRLCAAQRAAGLAPLAFPGQVMRYADPVWRYAYHDLAGPEAFRRFTELDPAAWRDPRMVRALEIVARLPAEAFAPGWDGSSHTGAQLALLEGRAAMTLSASWIANEMRARMPPGFELGAFNFPVFGDPAAQGAPGMLQTGSGYYFVFARGAHTREAVDFLRFLTSPARAQAFSKATDGPTAIRGTTGGLSPLMADTARMLETAPGSFDYPPQTVGPQAALAPALAAARQELLLGTLTAAQAAERLAAASEAELRRRADPGSVQMRHSGRALALGAVCLGLLALALRGFLGGRSRRASTARPEGATVGGGVFLGFTGPALLLYAVFALLPALVACVWSFRRWDGIGAPEAAGLGNFRWLLLESDTFWSALGNNLFLMLVPLVFVVPLALLFAAWLHRGVAGAGLFRAVVLFPNILGGIAGSLIWLHAYEPTGGLVNAAFATLGTACGHVGLDALGAWLLGFEHHAWLSPANLYWALVPIYVWMATGFNVVLYLAAMQGIDAELYDAAAIDGAGPWRSFVSVTLPGIRGTLMVTAVFFVIGGINTFEMVWLLTGQDPSASLHTLGTWMIHTLFREFQVGRAAALAVVMTTLVLLLSAALRGLAGKEESS